MSEWQAILTYLPDNKNGSRIVVSTKQLEIARLCAGQSYQVSELRKFPDNHSICAFFNKVRTFICTSLSLSDFFASVSPYFLQGFQRVEGGIVDSGSSLQNYLAESVVLVGRSSDEKEVSELISSASRGERPPCDLCMGFPWCWKIISSKNRLVTPRDKSDILVQVVRCCVLSLQPYSLVLENAHV